MKFEQLDRRMRVFETAHDHCVLPGIYMVARIDGRSFSHLTRVAQRFDAPYDLRFRDCMVSTVQHLMQCGFGVRYAYTQSDEISLLFRRDESLFGRKLRKYHSVLAGEASAAFSLALGALAAFDCRICQLPRREDVIDYFRWRNEDAHRNALNAHCYWLYRGQGLSDHEATERLKGVSVPARNELLFQHGINFNEIAAWEKRGIGFYWVNTESTGQDPRTGAAVTVTRRSLKTDFELPMKEAYEDFLQAMMAEESPQE